MKYADDAMVACVFREVPKNGKILEFDDTIYWNNKKYDSAEEFWQSADLKPMREKLVKMINEVNEKSACTADCD